MDLAVKPLGGRELAQNIVASLLARTAKVGVVGLGYVGLPLAVACGRAGLATVGFDIDPEKPARLNSGHSYIGAVKSEELSRLVASDKFRATDDFTALRHCDVIVICVPTPLSRQREPDLSFVEATARSVAAHLRPGQLVALESTSYPGTTREVVKPILEATGLRSGRDFLLAFSPEREDPGNATYTTTTIPKVVAGEGPEATRAAAAFYGTVVDTVVPVSSLEVAEAVKITENVFRAVNIALVNELKMIYAEMGIDIWEVIEGAKTKPFGYMPFYPGPGLGGHCIPIDPFYLAWKAREFDMPTRFIELAGEINVAMPRYVVGKVDEAIDRRLVKSLGCSRVLVLGLAYKKNIPDIRESPALKVIELLADRGAHVDYHDPYVAAIPETREYAALSGRRSVPIDAGSLAGYDAVVIVTDHDTVDYRSVVAHSKLVIDTRNVCGRLGIAATNVFRA
jgi:UDP-N-acetyl-D-glucosamine dehydrogenase